MAWPLEEKDLKRYPHFDRPVALAELNQLAGSPMEVATNAFLPFLKYEQTWVRFRDPSLGKKEQAKTRIIRYASRRDSAIFSRYRALLSEHYEKALADRGLTNQVLAYRRIPKSDGSGNKTNIDFAFEAFETIRKMGECCAVALDIKGYFDNMDHDLIKMQWCRLLGVTSLPTDHFRVFSAITRFASVDRDKLYERIGYISVKTDRGGGIRKKSIVPRASIPMQICTPEEFRSLVIGKAGDPHSLLEVNKVGFGIPQGAPISDVLANLYLIDFDEEIRKYVAGLGGTYFRYSDDILIVIPGGQSEGIAAADFVTASISKYGSEIRIKKEKTEIVAFSPNSNGTLSASNAADHDRIDGLEYLGFRFDGRRAYIRNKTLTGVLRKMKSAVRKAARRLVTQKPDKDAAFLERAVLRTGILQRFRKVRDFDSIVSKRQWTFFTYVRRAAKAFGKDGPGFYRQVTGQKSSLRKFVSKEVEKAIELSLPKDGKLKP